jgi:hypothetical protein
MNTGCNNNLLFHAVAAERLDDTKTEVRLQALQVLEAALPSEVPASYSSHLQMLFKTALIHLDDQDKNYRLAVFGKVQLFKVKLHLLKI